MAHFAPGQCFATGAEAAALETLPVEALRLEAAPAAALRQFGLRRIGQLYGRDRRALKARFGLSLRGIGRPVRHLPIGDTQTARSHAATVAGNVSVRTCWR